MQILIDFEGSEQLAMIIRSSDTILDIKRLVSARHGVPVDELLVRYGAKVLPNESKPVRMGVREGSTLRAFHKVRGGMVVLAVASNIPETIFVSMSRDGHSRRRLVQVPFDGQTTGTGLIQYLSALQVHEARHYRVMYRSRPVDMSCPLSMQGVAVGDILELKYELISHRAVT